MNEKIMRQKSEIEKRLITLQQKINPSEQQRIFPPKNIYNHSNNH
jgi:hypothetical protein